MYCSDVEGEFKCKLEKIRILVKFLILPEKQIHSISCKNFKSGLRVSLMDVN